MRIEPFTGRHLGPATRLLALRHTRDRARRPLLDECPGSHCAQLLERALADGATGAVALAGDEMIGYLLATPLDDEYRGRSMWVGPELQARAPDAGQETIRALYGHLARGWLDAGRLHHYAVVPVDDLDVWLSLGFPFEQAYGIRAIEPPAADPAGAEPVLRLAGPDDMDALAPLNRLAGEAGEAPPVLTYRPEDFYENGLEWVRRLLADDTAECWLAESDGDAVAFACVRPTPPEESSLVKPAGVADLVVAATAERARRRGIGTALTCRILASAHERGNRACVVDWRVANLTASVFWPRRGFTPYAYRLHRILDPRLAPEPAD